MAVHWSVTCWRMNRVVAWGSEEKPMLAQAAAARAIHELGRGLSGVSATVTVEGRPGGWNAKRDERDRICWERWEPVAA